MKSKLTLTIDAETISAKKEAVKRQNRSLSDWVEERFRDLVLPPPEDFVSKWQGAFENRDEPLTDVRRNQLLKKHGFLAGDKKRATARRRKGGA